MSPKPRSTPALERAKERADRRLPRAPTQRAAAPRTETFSELNVPSLAATSNAAWAGYTPPDSTGAIGPHHYVEL